MSITALIVPVSGPYAGTYQGYGLGMNDDNGFNVMMATHGEKVNRTDAYGQSFLEGIYQGQSYSLGFNCLEWRSANGAFSNGLMIALNPYNTPNVLGWQPILNGCVVAGVANRTIGDRYSKFAQSLVLDAVLSDPPTEPQSLTALGCILADQQNVKVSMTSKVRGLQLQFDLIPYVTSITVSGTAKAVEVPFTTV